MWFAILGWSLPNLSGMVVYMDGREALAKAFDEWFERSGMSQAEVAAAGGPSTTSQTKVRQSDGRVARQTLQKIDAVTGWAPGTALRILRGESLDGPTPENVGSSPDDEDSLLFRRPAGLSDQEWRSMQERMRGGWEWELRRADRER